MREKLGHLRSRPDPPIRPSVLARCNGPLRSTVVSVLVIDSLPEDATGPRQAWNPMKHPNQSFFTSGHWFRNRIRPGGQCRGSNYGKPWIVRRVFDGNFRCRLCIPRGANYYKKNFVVLLWRPNGETQTQSMLLLLMNTTYPSLCLVAPVSSSPSPGSSPASPPLSSSSPGLVGRVKLRAFV